MVTRRDDSDSASPASVKGETELKTRPVVSSTKLFSRTQDRTTFETESLESFYKPIDSYEGRHRFDPTFEW